MKKIFITLTLFLAAPVFAAVELDTDRNGATDISRGGTNSTTTSGPKANLGIPSTLSALTDDTTHRVVTDSEKSTWNGKANTSSFVSALAFQAAFGWSPSGAFDTTADQTITGDWAFSSGAYNTALGNSCLYSTTGSQNVAVGCYAGNKIVAGSSNIFIGYGAGNHNSQLTTASSSIAIGVNAYTTKDNQVVIGNDTTVETVLKGDVVFGKTKTPSSATDVGVAGAVSWDADYIYVCVATNTWKRVSIASW